MRWGAKRIFIGIGALLLLFVIAASYVPAVVRHQSLIYAPPENVMKAALNLYQWKSWHPYFDGNPDSGSIVQSNNSIKDGAFISQGQARITVEKSSLFGLLVTQQNGSKKSRLSLTVNPGFTDTVEVNLREEVSLLRYITEQIGAVFNPNGNELLVSLKNYLEDPLLYYGYKISITYTLDPLVLTTQQSTSAEGMMQAARSGQQKLESFIRKNQLAKQQNLIANFTPSADGNVTVMTGISVDKEVAVPEELFYQRMPRSRMVTGEYAGPFNEREKLHKAIQRYIEDHSLKPVALPFERYLNDSIPVNQNTPVRILIHYPIL